MTFPNLLTALAGIQMREDVPGWLPILYAAGAFAVVVLVLVLVRRKLKDNERWRNDDDED